MPNGNNILGSYNRVKSFDKNQIDRIKNLIKLNGICIFQHDLLSESCGLKDGEGGKTFFSALIDISNVVLTWHIFDEISASLENRGPFKELVEDVKSCVFEDDNFNMNLEFPYAYGFRDLEYRTLDPELMYTDFINSSLFQDFIVGTFSAFEYWMTKIYDHLSDVSCVTDRKKTKVKNLIRSINNNFINKDNNINEENKAIIETWLEQVQDQISDDIIKKFGSYVSASEKIEKVIAIARKTYQVKHKNNEYGLDPIDKDDLNLVKFYAAQRNSIHNLGIHSKSLNITLYDVEIKAGEASYFKNKSDNINLCLDLAKLFVKLITILDIDHNLLVEREIT